MAHHPELTLSDIDAAEGAVKTVRVKLQGIGRAIYQMREGKELGPQYGFDRYSRTNFAGSHFYEQEGPDWGVGTPIFSLVYYWPRAENCIVVTIPAGWIEQDWPALEAERLATERDAKAIRDRAAAKKRATDRAEAERKTYERLQAKFGANTPAPGPEGEKG